MQTDAHTLSSLVAAIVDSSHDAIVGLDSAGTVTTWNLSAKRIFGADESDARGASFERFLGPAIAPQWPKLLARVAAGERVSNQPMEMTRIDGLPVPTLTTMVPVRDAAERIVGACAVIRDRTEEALAQTTLADGEQRVRRSEALARTGSFVVDGRDGAVQWSHGMYELYGIAPGELDMTVNGHLEHVHVDDRPRVRAALDEALLGDKAVELDHRVVRGDGSRAWVFLAAEPERDASGRVVGVRGICQDVTARRQAEETVRLALEREQRASDELRRADRLKDEFLGTVSHELRTPLTSILGFASLLRRMSVEHQDYVETIERHSRDMRRMIERLLDYSRLQAGRVALERRPVDLAEHIRRFLDEFDGLGENQRFHADMPEQLSVVVDPDAVERIIGNLVSNACKYAGPDGVVRVAVALDDGNLTITVADDGPGIPLEYRDRLFERFFQVPGASTNKGTGIGLAVVRQYVELHGGTVQYVEPDGGVGATFVVSLPQTRETTA